ncbi:uncharacterized protein B0I36DRAFT_426925 [Microdochium trichocladiopsis]|uniref:Uncharacterized protein n=1 Tax=Microdochium trichocladiopsis TaxID=1682393 RepID=A0A9P8YI90_9PEZI|nr:uncharacterized protein B0I36DRAFT_426925 [Microdochium trichocladiopsis]KAH7040492.1 hypothetical protein B0I36DRAFT_426925 [Microdochium trichocladiopsis]
MLREGVTAPHSLKTTVGTQLLALMLLGVAADESEYRAVKHGCSTAPRRETNTDWQCSTCCKGTHHTVLTWKGPQQCTRARVFLVAASTMRSCGQAEESGAGQCVSSRSRGRSCEASDVVLGVPSTVLDWTLHCWVGWQAQWTPGELGETAELRLVRQP